MRRTGNLVAFLVVFSLLIAGSPVVFAQSGRGRNTPPPAPPKPTTPKQNIPVTTVLGIPDGGKLVRQELDNFTSRFELRNGLSVLTRERHSAPLVAVNVTIKAGILAETDEMAGIARLTQKAVLRGTATRNGAAIEREVARLGGQMTSQVGYDQTTFTMITAGESYAAMIELLADVILRPAFKDDDIKKAAAEVLLESKQAQDRVETAAMEKLFSAAFTTHRLKRGSAVSESFLASATSAQVQAFYQTHYRPSNAIVTVLGDVFTLNAIGQVQLRFGEFKTGVGSRESGIGNQPIALKPTVGNQPSATAKQVTAAKPSAVVQKPTSSDQTNASTIPANPITPITPTATQISTLEESAQDKLRYGNARADIGQSLVTFGYRTPSFKADKEGLKETAVLEVLSAVLGLGDGSRLSQGLRDGLASRDKLSVASATSFSYQKLPGFGMLVGQIRVEPERIDRAEAEYFREIERFRRELISEGELQRAKSLLEKLHFDSMGNFETDAELLAGYQARFGDWKTFDSRLTRVRAVTAQDVQQAAAKYLTLSAMTVAEYEPRTAIARTFTPEKFAELAATFAPAVVQPINATDVKPALALKTFAQGAERNQVSEGQNIVIAAVPLPIKDYSVLRGSRAYVREDKSLPLISISVLFQGGRLVEEQASSGTTELMLRAMARSTTTRKSDLIAHELESYGGQLRVVNEPDFFGFTLDVLSRNAENAVKLLLEIVETPYFGKEEIAREKTILLADQLNSRDDDAARADELLRASLYPGHPYGLPRFGLAEVVKAATEEKLEEWHNKTIKRQYPLLMIVGDTDGSALVSRIFSEGLKRGELDKALKVNLPPLAGSGAEKTEQRGRTLATQVVGFRLGSASPPQQANQPDDFFTMTMLATLASTGKLSEKLRTELGLVDSLTIQYQPRLASSGFNMLFATSPENEAKAREQLQAELQRLAALPADDEFEFSRNATIGRYAIALQSHPVRALEYSRAVFFGRKASEIEAQPDAIRAIKKADLKRAAESLKLEGRGVVLAGK
ncbi:MAG: pitrilysin family protein [Acidobacteriota bacterium]|nr:pitrilysin family protein [Acidobacteriota bacterium]